MPRVQLPPGCAQLKFADGDPRPVKAARPGGSVVVSDERAKMIDSMRGNGEGGLVHGKHREFGAVTKAGRWCLACRRLWYPWAVSCPRCGAETVAEQ